MNNTAEYWSIDGVSLHQYGWSVATFGGGRYGLPPRKGDNVRAAYRPGSIHRNKLADERTIDLVMWLTGADPATGNAVADPRLRFNDSWEFLRRLVWKSDGRQVELTRRWFLTVDGAKTLVTASAMAELADAVDLSMTGRTRADFTLRLRLADPFFYGPEITTPQINVGGSVSVTNLGTDIAAYGNLTVEFHGPLVNPRLTNTTPTPEVYVAVNDIDLDTGHWVELDIGNYTARRHGGGGYHIYSPDGYASVLGNIVHSGARHWMALDSGPNLLNFNADSGTGYATVTFRPPYV